MVEHLAELAGGRCSITEELILSTAEEDPAYAEILAGVLYLHDDLAYHAGLEARRAQDHALLDDATRLLAASIDAGEIARTAVAIMVGKVADACAVDVVTDAKLTRLAGPSDARATTTRGPNDPVAVAFATGHTQQPPASDDAPALLALPLIARGRRLGVLSLERHGPGRSFDADDLTLAEELTRRVALALDNAVLLDEARRAVKARDRFLALVSHELKNPLQAIMLQTELLASRTPDARTTIKSVLRAAERIDRLVGDLADVAASEAGRLTVQPSAHDIAASLAEASEPFGELCQARGLHYALELTDDLPRAAHDRDRLAQVLGNLVGNAIAATQPGGSIVVSTRLQVGAIVVSVTDTGSGIAPAELAHVFDTYYRAPDADYRGAGLGLAIARAIVEAHGGRMWVESRLGEGSSFSFSLPAA